MKTLVMTMTMAMMTVFNANAGNNSWRNPNPPAPPRTEVIVRYDSRYNNGKYTDWRTCRHTTLDRYGNKTYCRYCGSELIFKGNSRYGRYEVIPPRPATTNRPATTRPVTPPRRK